MSRTLLIVAVGLCAAFLPAGATGSPSATLNGVVGPGFNISLKNADGTGVSHLDPGTYTVNVDDESIEHNFHLRGPGVDQATLIETTGMTTWSVTVTDGTYTFICDAHPVQMKGSFTVGAVPPPSPVVPRLNGRITSKAISLKTSSGARVKTLQQNTYRITVTDSSKKQNFHLTGPGVNKKTSVAGTAKATWKLRLTNGKYTYRSDKNRRLRGTFRVTSGPPPG
jgi:hypothetical protein